MLDRFLNINRAQQSDPNDHLVEYYLGLGCACRALVAEAVAHTRAALKLCPEHAPSLHLMVLLLSAQKQLTEANALLSSALQDFPDNLGLLYVKTHLQLQTLGPEVMELTIVIETDRPCTLYFVNCTLLSRRDRVRVKERHSLWLNNK